MAWKLWALRAPLLAVSVLILSACASAGRLAEYDFRDRNLAVVILTPPQPQVFNSSIPDPGAGGGSLGERLIAAGAELVREASASEARDRLLEAASRVDVASIIADRTLERASRILRASPVESVRDADFELEIRLEEYGLTSNDWNAQALYFAKAKVLLIDSADGSLIWETTVDEVQPVNHGEAGLDPTVVDVVTAAVFATLSAEDMERALTGLAEFCAERASRQLQRGMDRARGG